MYNQLDINTISKEKAHGKLQQFEREFLEDRELEIKDIDLFLTDHNFESIKLMAHKWKGFSIPYGFHLLAELSVKLEEFCALEDIDQCCVLVNMVKEYLNIKRKLIGEINCEL